MVYVCIEETGRYPNLILGIKWVTFGTVRDKILKI